MAMACPISPRCSRPLNGPNALWLFFGNGAGAFPTQAGTTYSGTGGALADFNNDNRPDLELLNGGNPAIAVLLGSLAPTSVTLTTSSSSPIQVGQSVPLTANVSVNGYAVPGGTVSFMDGGTTLGTVPLNAATANLNVTLTPGIHNLTANYGGDVRTMVSLRATRSRWSFVSSLSMPPLFIWMPPAKPPW